MTSLPHDAGCIFCKIVDGEAPSFKLYEDELSFAIMDINPFNHGHALVLSKGHYANIHEVTDDSISAVARTAKKIAAAVNDVVKPDGINIVQANGQGAAQSVQHYHVHVLPRRIGDNARLNWSLTPGDQDSIAKLAADIRAILKT
ncbi:HIT family protein [uncultured Ferrovibrio sp.]|jgi:histidine triad (HIT) family protein|uniref:HIT family protein n=1 Tax=uncultured Ferrovibrio sp. TaxID=1576913 RepID=UPI00261EC046|nr:HIT family protein [uncultured Ferrovibrio sp.]